MSLLATVGIVLAASALHEAGHALAAQLLGLRWRVFLRFPVAVGIAAEPSRIVALAGPAASILAGLAAFELRWFTFAAVSLLLGVVSLVPVPPQDGWRVIRGAVH